MRRGAPCIDRVTSNGVAFHNKNKRLTTAQRARDKKFFCQQRSRVQIMQRKVGLVYLDVDNRNFFFVFAVRIFKKTVFKEIGKLNFLGRFGKRRNFFAFKEFFAFNCVGNTN